MNYILNNCSSHEYMKSKSISYFDKHDFSYTFVKYNSCLTCSRVKTPSGTRQVQESS